MPVEMIQSSNYAIEPIGGHRKPNYSTFLSKFKQSSLFPGQQRPASEAIDERAPIKL